jgi:hypothetical protein
MTDPERMETMGDVIKPGESLEKRALKDDPLTWAFSPVLTQGRSILGAEALTKDKMMDEPNKTTHSNVEWSDTGLIFRGLDLEQHIYCNIRA